ncbi:MAG: GGDEF domain-containing protein [Solobacterium sp.]|nr:GGDEF domain-containing protein [Solobacterium sp.]
MNIIEKTKEQGVSLRSTFLGMLLITVFLMVFLLFAIVETIHSFNNLSLATDTYIELQEAADSLMKASDYLTEEAQCYTVLGSRRHLENYFTEAEVTRRREKAISAMEERLPDSGALNALKEAMKESVSLMDREYYAMALMLKANNDNDVPETMKSVELSAEDLKRSPEEKMRIAREMMHDDVYYDQKNRIRTDLTQCIEELKYGTRSAQSSMQKKVEGDLVRMAVLIVIQSLAIILLLYVTTSLGINPLLQAVEHIKHDQELPITGANEFRYLASTYNTMYEAYRKSIDNLSFQASHDELTGVYNRAGYDLLKNGVDLKTTAFLLVDADRFKRINDDHGHEVGDLILKKIAGVLMKHFRNDDYVCRIGGDEFMVLMVHVSQEVRPLIETKVIEINRDLSDTEDGLPAVTVSVGAALCRDAQSPEELFHDADVALYYVKEHGRNGCCFYEPKMRDIPQGRT